MMIKKLLQVHAGKDSIGNRLQIKEGNLPSKYYKGNTTMLTCNIVQGSATGPTSYIVYTRDLETLSCNDMYFKYNRLVPENTDVGVDREFLNLLD